MNTRHLTFHLHDPLAATLDPHRLTAPEASAAVRRLLETWRRRQPGAVVLIITAKGKKAVYGRGHRCSRKSRSTSPSRTKDRLGRRMPQIADNLPDSFMAHVANSADLWRSIDIRVLAVRVADEWHNLVTRCYLDYREPDSVTKFPRLTATERVRTWQVVRPLSELADLVRQLTTGTLSLDESVVKYVERVGEKDQRPYNFHSDFSDLSDAHEHAYPFWSAHQLIGGGQSVGEVVRLAGGRRLLDNDTRTANVPFDGLNGLARLCVGSPLGLEPNRTCLVELFAPLEGLLDADHCSLDSGRLRYAITAGNDGAAQAVRLAVTGIGDTPVPGSQWVSVEHQSMPDEGELRLHGELAFPDYESATLLLAVGKYAVHRLELLDTTAQGLNSVVDAYRTVDHDLGLLRHHLNAEGPQGAAQFPLAVARLMTFAGFRSVVLSGDRRLEYGVDLLAHSSDGRICLGIECTTSSINTQGKLGKLVSRIELMRRAVPDSEVRGVIVTSIERDRIAQGDLQTAAVDELLVLGREDLDQLLELAVTGTNVREVLSFLWTRVPPKPPRGAHPLANWF